MKSAWLLILTVLFFSCVKEKEEQLTEYAYGPSPRHTMHFIPQNENCYLFIHGGGWIQGDKSDWHDTYKVVLRKGYSYAAMNHRFSNETDWRGMQEDIDRCVQKLKIAGIKNIYLVGASAGTSIALLYASNHDVKGVICFATIASTVEYVSPELEPYVLNYGEVSVFDSTFNCPLTLIHCKNDWLTYYTQSEMMNKGDAKLITLEGYVHVPGYEVIHDILDREIK